MEITLTFLNISGTSINYMCKTDWKPTLSSPQSEVFNTIGCKLPRHDDLKMSGLTDVFISSILSHVRKASMPSLHDWLFLSYKRKNI